MVSVTELLPRRGVLIVCAVLTLAPALRAQLSPGELSAAHASLEGMANCTKCHTLGKAISNDNCLTCHKELRSRIAQGRGFHAPLAARQCVECHKEHHGRTFQVVRFDVRSFDHTTAGFPLKGKHRALDCANCHTSTHVTASDIRANPALMASHTYLGLSRDCSACHRDQHRGQLAPQCQTCHGEDGWKPAVNYDHARTKFPLTGKHLRVECARCHPLMNDDRKTVKFVGLMFEKCSACHVDPHNGRFQKACESCHSTNGWGEGASKNFNHATTRFPLRGLHASVRCDLCHVPVRNAADGKVVQRFAVKKFQKCSDCHSDPHAGEFAAWPGKGACEECHTERGFAPSLFVHAKARYDLQGRHATLACQKCHPTPTIGPTGKKIPPSFRVKDFSRCTSCHDDAHAGQFARVKNHGACESCHTVQAFLPAVYSVANHATASFALTGEHEAVACGRCHVPGAVKAKGTRQFVWNPPARCQTCHKDPHGGQFSGTRYASCENCHSAAGWKVLVFSHKETRFPLTGKHAGVACVACHKPEAGSGNLAIRRFVGTPTRCIDCHSQADVRALSLRNQ